MKCNICGSNEFVDMNARKNVKCGRCFSLERTRLVWLFLSRLDISSDKRVLHLAPERGVYHHLKAKYGDNYTCADFEPKNFPYAPGCKHIDLCNLESWPSQEFDLILHVHVLEHIPCNIAYSLFHLHRMLKPSGIHLFVIPFTPGRYEESLADIGDQERVRRFFQADHVRCFGSEDREMHIGRIVKLPQDFDATKDFPKEVLHEANIPESLWRGFHSATVLQLKRTDYSLSL